MAKWRIPIYNGDGKLEWITVDTPLMPVSLIAGGAHPVMPPNKAYTQLKLLVGKIIKACTTRFSG